jgi:hypothetical protein
VTVIVCGGEPDLVTSFVNVDVDVTVIVFGGGGDALYPPDLVTSFVEVNVTVTGGFAP